MRVGRAVGLGMLILGCVCVVAGFSGARINTTKSIPRGLYWTSSSPASSESYVMFCPPRGKVFDEAMKRGYIDSGVCPGGYGYMMKKILAAKHDVISIEGNGVFINGRFQPLSKPLKSDRENRPLPQFRVRDYVMPDTEVLLMSDVSKTSFDGRYFGPVKRSQIVQVIRPVFTW